MFADAIWIIYINLLPNQIKNNIQTVMMITAGNFQMITNIFSKLFTISPDPTVATPSIWACGSACALHDYCGGFIFDKTSVRNPSNFNLSNNTKSSLKLVVVVFNSDSKTFHKRNLWERKNPVAFCFWKWEFENHTVVPHKLASRLSDALMGGCACDVLSQLRLEAFCALFICVCGLRPQWNTFCY